MVSHLLSSPKDLKSYNRRNSIDLERAMQVMIQSPKTLGLLIRATRKTQRVRMDDLAGSAGVGPVFVREVERGKETVQLGRVLSLLAELGIELRADVPDNVLPAFERLRQVGVKPLNPRRPKETPPGRDEA
jgi:transcriptional regulator with XRE-family HTH domain